MIALALHPFPGETIDRRHDVTTTTDTAAASTSTTATTTSTSTATAIANRALGDWYYLADSGVVQDLIFSKPISHLNIGCWQFGDKRQGM